MRELTELLQKLCDEGFTGNVQLNFFKGTIANINKNESIKLKEREHGR